MAGKRPRQTKTEIIEALRQTAPPGEYRLYSASSQLPPGVPWAGHDCQCVVLAASTYYGRDVPGLPSGMTPDGDIYLCRAFRADPAGSPHWNVDDSLYYVGRTGSPWMIHSKESPDHYRAIMSGSGLAELAEEYYLPSISSGTLAQYRERGAHLDFEEPFWGSR